MGIARALGQGPSRYIKAYRRNSPGIASGATHERFQAHSQEPDVNLTTIQAWFSRQQTCHRHQNFPGNRTFVVLCVAPGLHGQSAPLQGRVGKDLQAQGPTPRLRPEPDRSAPPALARSQEAGADREDAAEVLPSAFLPDR